MLGHANSVVQVYGSHGWQCLTGLRDVRNDSDLDLGIAVPDLATATAPVALLAAQTVPCRIDGELILPNGHAVAWREMAQLLDGQVKQALSQRLDGIALVALTDLQPATGAAEALHA